MTELAHRDLALPVGSIGSRASGWWGAWFLLISEASLFAYLFFAYFYYSIQPQAEWVPGHRPSFLYSAPQSALVLIGCATAWLAQRAAVRGQATELLLALAGTLVLGAGFIALQFLDWFSKDFTFASSAYGSIYYTIGGFHLAHFVVGWLIFLLLLAWSALGYVDPVRHLPITVGALYWYFLAVTWLAVFFVLDVTPYLT